MGTPDLRSAQLDSLSIRMVYADLSRVELSWASLTTLTFGSPIVIFSFFPSEALRVLRFTPNIVDCMVHLHTPIVDQTPISGILTLAHLESLTIMGDTPHCIFAEALHLPRLTRLFAGEAMTSPESGSTSVVSLWIEKYGAQLREVSIAHSSLAKPALSVALKNLLNVESLKLVWNPESGAAAIGNEVALGFRLSEVDVLGELDPDDVTGCSCPKLQALTLRVGDGGATETREVIVGLIEKRRSASRPSWIARLDKVDLSFRVPSGRSILHELKVRGVDTEGVSIRTESRDGMDA
jgi:hypothetical protein